MEKVKRNGEIAVLYSPGFGAGWSTWMNDDQAAVLLYHPEIVKLVEENNRTEITDELCKKILGVPDEDYVCTLGARDLEIKWVKEGLQFEIDDYDGSESIHIIGDRPYNVA